MLPVLIFQYVEDVQQIDQSLTFLFFPSQFVVQHQPLGAGRDPREEPAVRRFAHYCEGTAQPAGRPQSRPNECHAQRREVFQIFWYEIHQNVPVESV